MMFIDFPSSCEMFWERCCKNAALFRLTILYPAWLSVGFFLSVVIILATKPNQNKPKQTKIIIGLVKVDVKNSKLTYRWNFKTCGHRPQITFMLQSSLSWRMLLSSYSGNLIYILEWARNSQSASWHGGARKYHGNNKTPQKMPLLLQNS